MLKETKDFVLHAQLEQDSFHVGQFELCELRLINDSQYPWCLLIPKRADIQEVYQLSQTEQAKLWQESAILSRNIQTLFKGDKLNIAAIGNMVPQLHLHHIVRYKTDPSWPKPVWGQLPLKPYSQKEKQARIALLKEALPNLQ